MKAVVFDAFADYHTGQIRDIPAPVPGPGEVAIEVHAADCNFADTLVISGQYQVKPPLPFSPGKGVAGIIAALGEAVTGFAQGERVMAQVEYGAYAEVAVAPAASTFHMPEAMSFTAAAAIGLVYQTAYFGLRDRGRFEDGESVLVLGAAGAMGVATIQLVKAWGGSALATARSPASAEMARRAGADHVIDLTMDDLREELRAAVHGVTDKRGVDVVVDHVGGDVTEAALRCLAWRGRCVIVGFAAGAIPSIRANYLLLKNISVAGLQWSNYRDFLPDQVRHAQDEIFALYEAGKIAPIVTRTAPLARYSDLLDGIVRGEIKSKAVLLVREQ